MNLFYKMLIQSFKHYEKIQKYFYNHKKYKY